MSISLPKSTQQQGIISIMMTMVMMIVISLIILGLAQVSRREQRQTLDAQLSAQAFYAAESGVNDAVATIGNFTGAIPAKTDCAPDTNYSANNVIDSDSNISYSCLLVDPTPPQLTQKLSSQPAVLHLKTADDSAFGQITLRWTKATGSSLNVGDCPSKNSIQTGRPFAPAGNWQCPYGVLKVDLVPITGNLSRSALINNTTSVFIVPSSNDGDGFLNVSSQKSSVLTAKDCDTVCEYRLQGLGDNEYYMRVSELYQTGQLTITGTNNTEFSGSQVIVDVTGKAQDVLRRVRVAVDVSGGNQNATVAGALFSGHSICKRFSVAPGYFYNDDLDTTSSNPLCKAQSFLTDPGAAGVDGGIDGGGADPGGGGGGPWPLSWRRAFHVTAAPPNVEYCVWNFGDGSSKQYTAGDCLPYARTVTHEYPNPPTTCTHYTVNLTFYYPGGIYKADPYGTYVPHNGDPAVPGC